MDIFNVLTFVGGLAFFLFGMNLLSNGLETMVGGKLESVLKKMTSSRIKGLTLGAVITAVIQSSSAMTVMLVGLVNSGIMSLRSSIGVIMGSNIGTTITAWILSLTGIDSSSVFVRLLKPESFAPVVAMAGIIIMMSSNEMKRKNIGSIMLGFSILMSGMSLMSSSVSGLAEEEAFTNVLTMFNNPFVGVVIGAIFTAIIQSSSASMGIMQALSLTGKISYGMSIPLIMGQNIGTCITALLSSIGTNKNAKRVTVVHISFNVIGTVICLSAFYLTNSLLNLTFINQAINPLGIAVVHTTFNLITTFLLFPFGNQLEKLAKFIVRDAQKTVQPQTVLLDERLLISPSFAVAESRKATVSMAEIARSSLLSAIRLTEKYDGVLAEELLENEREIDMYEDKIGSYLVKLSGKTLSNADSNSISQLLHTIGDVERIGDHAVNLLRVAEEIHEKNMHFSKKAKAEIDVLSSAVIEIVNTTIDGFAKDDIELAYKVEPLEQVIDKLKEEMRNRHIQRLQKGKCTIELGFVFSDMVTNFERVSDHCSNIAVCQIQIANSTMDTHIYLDEVKYSGEPRFTKYYNEYLGKYVI